MLLIPSKHEYLVGYRNETKKVCKGCGKVLVTHDGDDADDHELMDCFQEFKDRIEKLERRLDDHRL